MVKHTLFRSAALAALAIAAAVAAPAQAQDIDRSTARAERQAQRAEARAERQQQRAAAPQQRVERQQQRAERQQQRAQAPQGRNAPDGGWRSQRAGDGQRYGRNWDNGGTVSRPAPAWRGATASTPDRGVTDQATAQRWGERNRSYSDGARNRTYRDGSRADRREDRVENRQAYRSGYRDGTRADSYRDRRDQSSAYRQGYTSGSRDYRRWDRNDWRRNTRYNWYGYRNQHRDLYRVGRYYSPYRNYSYNRLSIGFFLDSGFYGNRYWINDPWQYRLPEVYGPYRWVRYYDDVLLVDIYTGEVVDVIHDFFW
ncbi:MAG TPA: RcnB family protein [Reyranella sp.]|nr:RcnB family protein [Reyranella sp.]